MAYQDEDDELDAVDVVGIVNGQGLRNTDNIQGN
jgi:hypothetical protein